MRATGPPMRALLGFIAGALSVLVFHQGTWALFHVLGLMPPPYPMDPVPPWDVPLTDGWTPRDMLVVAAIHMVWGIGTGFTLQTLPPRSPRRATG